MIKITNATRGYFLTIGDELTENTWAVTAQELLELLTELRAVEESLEEEVDLLKQEDKEGK